MPGRLADNCKFSWCSLWRLLYSGM